MDDQLSNEGQFPLHHREAHEIEYKIHGHDVQCVEIILDPGEVAVAESGAMMFMESGVQMDTKISDGSKKNSGMVGSLVGMAKRNMTGEGGVLNFFMNKSPGRRTVGFSAPHPGSIVPIDLLDMDGAVMCHKGGFLCSAKGIAIDFGIVKKVGAGFFGGEGFIMQKLSGDGIAFVGAGGTILRREVAAGEKLYIDTGSIVAFKASMKFDIHIVTGMMNMMFGGEQLFLSTVEGPGTVWIQSLPHSRTVNHLMHTMEEIKKGRKTQN